MGRKYFSHYFQTILFYFWPVIDLRKHIGVAIFYFLLVALMGVLLRAFYVFPVSLNYKYILHAHSHTALLGWIYLGITTLVYKIFLAEAQMPRLYKWIFLFTNLCILGMLVTFPIQGYALFSIIFSTLFLFASYWFTWFALRYVPEHFKSRFSWKMVHASLWYLVLSSIGPWAVGGVMATLGSTSIWYKISIYFYLHFQYNGWFIFALLGILFYLFEEFGVKFNSRKLKFFFFLLNLGVILSLFLSILWTVPPKIYYWVGGLGAVVQIVAFYQLFYILKRYFDLLKQKIGKLSFLLLKWAAVLMLVKILMQFLSAIPHLAAISFVFKDFVLGYLHLVFLGIIIPMLLGFLRYFKLIRLPKSFVLLYLIAFVSTEGLIFYKGFSFWLNLPFFSWYFLLLALLSCLFPVAVGILFFYNRKNFYLSAQSSKNLDE